MKHLITAFFTVMSMAVFAQSSPEAFNYQGVARDNGGNVLANQLIGLRIAIQDGIGTDLYVERHTLTTNDFGLFNNAIGTGIIISGSFSLIDWASDSHYVNVQMDPAGGTSYVNLGVSQLVSVPYALHSKSSEDGMPDGIMGQTLRASASGWETTTNLYNDGTNVGIGSTLPSEKLEVNGNVAITGSSRSIIAESAFNIEATTGVDVIIDSDDNSTNSSFRVKRNSDGSETIFEAKENGDVEVEGEYAYASSKTHYQSFAWNAFRSAKPQSYMFGQSSAASINDRYGVFVTGASFLGYAEAALNLPDGAKVTEMKAWVYDNENETYAIARVQLIAIQLGTDDATQQGSTLESDGPAAIGSVQELTASMNVTIDNSTKAYHIRFTGKQGSDDVRLYGVRLTYTVDQAD